MDGYEYAMEKREQQKKAFATANMLREFSEKCEHRYEEWDEYTRFWGCKKKRPWGRHNPGCEPTQECIFLK